MLDVQVELIFELRLNSPDSVRSILKLLEGLGAISPAYWGLNERKRLPWDVDAIIQGIREEMGRYLNFYWSPVYLWRTRSPKWFGSLLVGDGSISCLSFEVANGIAERRRRDFLDELEHLVAKLPVIFGAVWFARGGRARSDEKTREHYRGKWVDIDGIQLRGLPPISQRTWIGGIAAERVGVARLLGIPNTRRIREDLFQIDLTPAPPEDATESFYSVMDALVPSGMFHVGTWDPDFTVEGRPAPQVVYDAPKAPNWEPPDWIVCRGTKDAAIASGKIPPAAVERALWSVQETAPAPPAPGPLPAGWIASRETGVAAQGGDLSGRDLQAVDFSNMKVNGPVFTKCVLRGTSFAELSALNAKFDDSDASGADFRETTFLQASFARTRAKGAFFTRARLHVCSFAGAELEDADFDGAELDSSYFMKAVARGATFRRARGSLVELDDANLAGADFTEASLPSADFRGSNLAGANFARATLKGADFRGANLSGAQWTGAVLDGATFDETPPDTGVYKK
jgi:uncharacterized protein YjbI with pentapeptide repeats